MGVHFLVPNNLVFDEESFRLRVSMQMISFLLTLVAQEKSNLLYFYFFIATIMILKVKGKNYVFFKS